MKIIILLLLLIAFHCRIRKLKKSNPKPIKVKLFCEQSTNIKYYIENGNPDYIPRRDCESIKYAEYDLQGDETKCNDKKYKIQKNSLERLSVTELVKYPVALMWKILKVSDCKNKNELIAKVYNSKGFNLNLKEWFVSFYQIGINLTPIPTGIPSVQFYDEPHNYILFYGYYQGVNLNFIADQINKFPGIPAEKKLVLDTKDDLVIKQVALYKRPFVAGTFHELISICASNGSKNYFFILHRGAKSNKIFTAVKISYYMVTNDMEPCENGLASSIDAQTQLIAIFNMGEEYCDSIRSFSSIVDLSVKYTENKPLYRIFTKNCQHFAVGFFNLLSGLDMKTNDFNLNKKPKFIKINKEFLKNQEEYDKNVEKHNEAFMDADKEWQMSLSD